MKLKSLNSIIYDYFDDCCLKGSIVISDEKEFMKLTKLFLAEAINFHVESLLVIHEETTKALEELEAFEERILN